MLERWREEATGLWSYQETLRSQACPGCQIRPPTDERLTRIAQRLDGGATPEECKAVLRHYASEARQKGSPEWFDGVTNWRPDNFERALGKASVRSVAPAGQLGAPPAAPAPYAALLAEDDERRGFQSRPAPATPSPLVRGLIPGANGNSRR